MSECIEWEGSFNHVSGYGQISGMTAHRMALAIKLRRAVRTGYLACHTCDNRKCINPDHLYEGTPSQNQRDRAVRNPSSYDAIRGENNDRSRITDADLDEMRRRRAEGEAIKDLMAHYGYSSYASVWRLTDGKQTRVIRPATKTRVV